MEKLTEDAVKILTVLNGNESRPFPLYTSPELRGKTNIPHFCYIAEMQPLLMSSLIVSKYDKYQITKKGKKALKNFIKLEKKEGKSRRLFNETPI